MKLKRIQENKLYIHLFNRFLTIAQTILNVDRTGTMKQKIVKKGVAVTAHQSNLKKVAAQSMHSQLSKVNQIMCEKREATTSSHSEKCIINPLHIHCQ